LRSEERFVEPLNPFYKENTMTNSIFDLNGKVALVTGGNGGIGLGMAEALVQAGADVCIWGRNAEKNQAAEHRLQSRGRRVLALQCDVADEHQVEECFAHAIFNYDKFKDRVISRIPQRRWGIPADFGPIAVYFAGDASQYHSGDAVVIDGGYSCF